MTLLRTAAMVAAVLLATEARADDLQNQVLAVATATHSENYAFRRTITIERTGSPRKVMVEQYDPRRPVAARWSLVSVDGRAPTAKEADQSRKANKGPHPSYAQIAKWFGAPATRSDAAPGYVTYRFARLPAGALKVGSHDASADTQAEAVVNTKGKTPFVERVRLTTSKAFSMMLVASVKSMVLTGRYAALPDGTVVPAESNGVIAGAFMGQSGQMKTGATFGDFRSE